MVRQIQKNLNSFGMRKEFRRSNDRRCNRHAELYEQKERVALACALPGATALHSASPTRADKPRSRDIFFSEITGPSRTIQEFFSVSGVMMRHGINVNYYKLGHCPDMPVSSLPRFNFASLLIK